MTKIDIINKVANHYNSNNRSASPEGGCFYFLNDKTCAVGLFLKNPKRFEDQGHIDDALEKGSIIMSDFKDEVQHIKDPKFWRQLQSLHDSTESWDETGLTESGREYYQELLVKYKDELPTND